MLLKYSKEIAVTRVDEERRQERKEVQQDPMNRNQRDHTQIIRQT